MKILSLISLALLLASCSCGDDIRLVRACSWETDRNIACTGYDTSYEKISGAQLESANMGVCQSGVLRCRRNSQQKEEYCQQELILDEQQCDTAWHGFAKFDTICVGYEGRSVESCHDSLDSNCDGDPNDGFDLDNDGFLNANMFRPLDGELMACGQDCNDLDPAIHPNAVETCDGIDNDCDGLIDEGLDAPRGSCEPDVPDAINPAMLDYGPLSQCKYESGHILCLDGSLVCDGARFVGPTPEMCNGLDDDCDGEVDYTIGQESDVENEGAPCGTNVGICEYGRTSCISQDMQCIGGVEPITFMPDACDGLDTDCDGEVDEDAEPRICSNGCPISGVQACQGGEWTPCSAPGPGNEDTEPCNGMDDDCDGQVDEGQDCQCDREEVGPNAPDCSPQEMRDSGLLCGTGKKNCECQDGDCRYGSCYLTCDPWVDAQGNVENNIWGACPQEQCDGWDWNCFEGNRDGLVEVPCECSINSPVDEIRAAATQGQGDCEIGQCTAGSQTCQLDNITQTWNMMPLDCNAVGPTEEVCDEVDNDCDTEVDEDLRSFEKVDMVFIIDVTGSMEEEIENIHNAIAAYAADFSQTEHRFSLVLFPAPYNPNPTRWQACPATACGTGNIGSPVQPPFDADRMPYWRMTPLSEVGDFLNALDDVLNPNVGGLVCAEEPSYDVISDIASPADVANINWREDAYPYIFFIGDEDGQTWRGITEASLSQRTRTCNGIGMCPCAPPNCEPEYNLLELHCFVSNAHAVDYDDVCLSTHDINHISAPLLRNIFADVCLPTD